MSRSARGHGEGQRVGRVIGEGHSQCWVGHGLSLAAYPWTLLLGSTHGHWVGFTPHGHSMRAGVAVLDEAWAGAGSELGVWVMLCVLVFTYAFCEIVVKVQPS